MKAWCAEMRIQGIVSPVRASIRQYVLPQSRRIACCEAPKCTQRDAAQPWMECSDTASKDVSSTPVQLFASPGDGCR